MSLTDTPQIMYEDAAQLIASWHNVVVSVMGHTPMTEAGVRAQVATTSALGRASGPQRLVEISLFDRNAPVPSAEVRAVLEAGVAVVGPYYLAVAFIFEASGFRAAIIRGVLTSLSLLSRSEFSQRVFSSAPGCVEWCSPWLQRTRTPDATELAEVIEHVRCLAIQRRVLSPSAVAAPSRRATGSPDSSPPGGDGRFCEELSTSAAHGAASYAPMSTGPLTTRARYHGSWSDPEGS